jgi:hypothetical protein
MRPINFPQATMVLGKPAGMTDDECMPLPVAKMPWGYISCWELSDMELTAICISKKLYISVVGGHPPILPAAENPLE